MHVDEEVAPFEDEYVAFGQYVQDPGPVESLYLPKIHALHSRPVSDHMETKRERARKRQRERNNERVGGRERERASNREKGPAGEREKERR